MIKAFKFGLKARQAIFDQWERRLTDRKHTRQSMASLRPRVPEKLVLNLGNATLRLFRTPGEDLSVAWYIVLEREIFGFDHTVNGKALAKA